MVGGSEPTNEWTKEFLSKRAEEATAQNSQTDPFEDYIIADDGRLIDKNRTIIYSNGLELGENNAIIYGDGYKATYYHNEAAIDMRNKDNMTIYIVGGILGVAGLFVNPLLGGAILAVTMAAAYPNTEYNAIIDEGNGIVVVEQTSRNSSIEMGSYSPEDFKTLYENSEE